MKTLKPKVFVFENVYGITGANNGEAWKEINEAFSSLGYKVSAEIIDAADYGVAQHRERLILVGSLTEQFVFPEPTNGPDSSTGNDLVSVFDVIHDIQVENDEPEPIGGLYGHLLPLVPEGLNYAFFTKEMGYPEPYFAWRSKFHDFLYKADRSKPCRTLKAQPGKFTGPFHWNNRHFTLQELKRIQSFPDDYIITGTSTQVMAQIGNSVPPRLAEVIAVSVREQLLSPTKQMTYPLRKDGFQSTFRQRQRATTEYYRNVAKSEIERRFGEDTNYLKKGLAYSKAYYIGYKDRYHGDSYDTYNGIESQEGLLSRFAVQSLCSNGNIRITTTEIGEEENYKIFIRISGLKKYLITVDELTADASVSCIDRHFEVWDIIQRELVDMSQFYSLIDIYGHYANRGDTVKISTEIRACSGCDNNAIIVALNYFGSSEHCGVFMRRSSVAESIGINLGEVDKLVSELRSLRFDARTASTHPTITTDDVLCTYPFPMLSERVMFDRKLK